MPRGRGSYCQSCHGELRMHPIPSALACLLRVKCYTFEMPGLSSFWSGDPQLRTRRPARPSTLDPRDRLDGGRQRARLCGRAWQISFSRAVARSAAGREIACGLWLAPRPTQPWLWQNKANCAPPRRHCILLLFYNGCRPDRLSGILAD